MKKQQEQPDLGRVEESKAEELRFVRWRGLPLERSWPQDE